MCYYTVVLFQLVFFFVLVTTKSNSNQYQDNQEVEVNPYVQDDIVLHFTYTINGFTETTSFIYNHHIDSNPTLAVLNFCRSIGIDPYKV